MTPRTQIGTPGTLCEDVCRTPTPTGSLIHRCARHDDGHREHVCRQCGETWVERLTRFGAGRLQTRAAYVISEPIPVASKEENAKKGGRRDA